MQNIKTTFKTFKDLQVKSIPFDAAIGRPDNYDALYIGTVMGKDIEADQFIIDAWQGRKRRDNTITHLRGVPELQARSHELWLNADLDNYISPEAIRKQHASTVKQNKTLLQQAIIASEECTRARINSLSPRRVINDLLKKHPELREEYKNKNQSLTLQL